MTSVFIADIVGVVGGLVGCAANLYRGNGSAALWAFISASWAGLAALLAAQL